ncbi:MAG: hypothetical protein IKB21_01875 [Clostridia bacterium]|nr:hypothetical protein [Clostridia bacterium]
MFQFKVSAKSTAAAIQKGLELSGLDKNDVEIKILRQAKNFQDAQIAIVVPDEIVQKNPKILQLQNANGDSAPTQDVILPFVQDNLDQQKPPAARVESFVAGIFRAAKCLSFEVETIEDDVSIHLNFRGPGLQKFVGANGRVLASIQTLANAFLQNQKRVVLDINDFKAHKAQKVVAHAEKIAKQVLESGAEIALKPMNAFERRLVHNAIANFETLATESRGEKPNRFVVISIKQSSSTEPNQN